MAHWQMTYLIEAKNYSHRRPARQQKGKEKKDVIRNSIKYGSSAIYPMNFTGAEISVVLWEAKFSFFKSYFARIHSWPFPWRLLARNQLYVLTNQAAEACL